MKILKPPKLDKSTTDWFGGNVALSSFMYALSTTFPEGERFFMKAVTQHLPEIKDKQLVQDIKDFCKQESNHGRLHQQMNRGFDSEEINNLIVKLEHSVGEFLSTVSKCTTKKQRLLITICLEHLTSILGSELILRTDLTSRMEEDQREAWLYHSIEEFEHKAVSFDVYEYIYGYKTKILRSVVMPIVIIGLASVVLKNWVLIMDSVGYEGFFEAVRILFGEGGFISNLKPEYKKWFNKEFHPNK